LEHVRAMGEAAARVSLAASGRSQTIEGRVSITASDILSAFVLTPIVADLRRSWPRIEIEIVAANDIRDLQAREADIAIRHVRPGEPELIARLVQEATARFYATTDYLDRRGRPANKADLDGHDFISFGDPVRMIEYLAALGIDLKRENFPLSSENGIVAWELAKHGLGIAAMSDEMAALTPGIERVLPAMAPITFPVWLTAHRELHTSRRIRLVYDFLAEALSRPMVGTRNSSR